MNRSHLFRWSLILGVTSLISAGCFGHGISGSNKLFDAAARENSASPSDQGSPYVDLDGLSENSIVHLPTGLPVTKEDLFTLIGSDRVVYVGESHTNVLHHRIELEVLKELLRRRPGKVSLGMEMFQRPSQPVLNDWVAGRIGEKAFAREYYRNWNLPFDYYRDILVFARENGVPIVALNASEKTVMELMQKGPDGLSEETRMGLPEFDVSDPYHRESMRAAFQGHGHGSEAFDSFYRTMLLWDETMAEAVADYLKEPENAETQMVVMAGGFHVAHGFGIPRRVFRRLPESYSIIVPHTPIRRLPPDRGDLVMDVTPPSLPLYLGDFAWVVGYEDLEGKHPVLGVRIEQGEGGVLVTDVVPGSAAERAGLKAGDLILRLGDEVLEEPFDLSYAVSLKTLGEEFTLQFQRGLERIQIVARF